MNTTRINATGQDSGTAQVQTEQIKVVEKVKISNPSPLTVRVDATGASQGTTNQRAESLAFTLDGSQTIVKP